MKYVLMAILGLVIWIGPLIVLMLRKSNRRTNKGNLEYAERLNLRR